MTNISALPDEVLIKIFAMVSTDTPVFACVCTRWREVVPENLRTWDGVSKLLHTRKEDLLLKYFIMTKNQVLLSTFIIRYGVTPLLIWTLIRNVRQNNLKEVAWFLSNPHLVQAGLKEIHTYVKREHMSPEIKTLLYNTYNSITPTTYVGDDTSDEEF